MQTMYIYRCDKLIKELTYYKLRYLQEMYDEDFLLGLDGMGVDGALMGDRGGGGYLSE